MHLRFIVPQRGHKLSICKFLDGRFAIAKSELKSQQVAASCGRSLFSIFVFICLTFTPQLVASQGITIYMSPKGNDNWTGSEDAPLASLEGARERLRTLKAENNYNDTIRIIIKEGTYQLTRTFRLSAEDSGTPEAPIVYEAATGSNVVFSGGTEKRKFSTTENGVWKVQIPEVTYWNWKFDQLYVNGRRAIRARTPNNGFFHLEDVKEEVWIRGTGRAPEKARQIAVVDEAAANELDALDSDALNVVIMTVYHKWNITKRFFDSYDPETATIYTSGQGMKPWNQWTKGKRFILENYSAALDEPGEWFLAADGTLYYYPLPNEDINTSTFVIPVVEQLVKIGGDATNGKFVNHVTFRNLQFEYASTYLPKEGFEPYQAAIGIDAAIELNHARNIQFTNCELKHVGGYGIWLNQGVSDCAINHCYIYDLGAGGVRIGETTIREKEHLKTHSNVINNNIITSGGYDYPTAVGVWIGQSAHNQITHNEISNFRYTGVSVGWVWGYSFSPAKGNKVMYNHIHHIGWGLLSDMAGVYTLGTSEGTKVSNNHVHHIYAYDYGGWGLYTDEGSSHIVMENNLVHHTKTGGFHQHYGRENTLRNNIFAFSKMYQLQATRVEEHLSFSFTNNIVIYDEGVLYQGPWTKMQVEIDKNLYWKIGGEVDFLGKSLKEWNRSNYDTHSHIEDPLFRDPQNGDFGIKNKNPIKKIGFKQFDYSGYGVYGSDDWKEKAILPESVILEFNNLFN